MKIKILIHLLISSFLITGCYTKKQAISKFCHSELNVKDSIAISFHDSVITLTNIKDSTVIHPKSVFEFNINDICDSLGRLKKINIDASNGKNNLSIHSDGNKLYITANCDSVIERLRFQISELKSTKSESQINNHSSDKTVTLPPPSWIKILPRYMWFCFGESLLVQLFLILWLINKYRRKIKI
jgi:hypothetical protein